ncbi:MAG: acetyl esterase [Sphingomonadales bacterium]|jgi:acetyl esterase|nr:acetyl esterase [Sphingomonadales bacterium]
MAEPFVRPDVRQLLEFLDSLPGPRSHEVGPEGARQMMVTGRYALDAPARDIAVERDIAGPVPLRLYDAREERGPGPLLVFIHGGGWVIGGLETHDPLCIELAIELDLPVVAVDYRLAPEHPFPAAFEDSLAAVRWIAGGPKELGRVATSLFLAGDSAGGNLAAAVSAALRDEPAAVPVAGQWLIYPAADPCVRYPSYDQFNEGFLLTKASMDWFEESYAGPRGDWRYSPLLAGAEGLPPTFVLTAGLDPIRDQGRAYAARCAEAGVETIYWEAPGTIHGFINLRKALPSANDDLAHCLAYLKPWVERAR